MIKSKLPMRKGVGIIILNKQNKVFVAKRKDNPIDKWQMPQGGVTKERIFILQCEESFRRNSIKSIEILKELDGFLNMSFQKN